MRWNERAIEEVGGPKKTGHESTIVARCDWQVFWGGGGRGGGGWVDE